MAIFNAETITITIGNAISGTPNTSTSTFKTQLEGVGSNEFNFESLAKDIDFKAPEKTTDSIPTLGATSGIQNSELDPHAPTKAEFTGTLLLSPEATNNLDFLQFAYTAEATPATGYTRYGYASAPPTAGVAVNINVIIATWVFGWS